MRKVKRNDTVQVMTGRDRGKRGQVRQATAGEGDRIVVHGVNIVKRHMRARSMTQPAGIIELEAPIHISNVRVVCPQCSQPARVGFRLQTSGAKVRYCRKCDADID